MTKALSKKYLVLKWDDINKLPEEMINNLKSIISQIEDNRTSQKKLPTIRLINIDCYD